MVDRLAVPSFHGQFADSMAALLLEFTTRVAVPRRIVTRRERRAVKRTRDHGAADGGVRYYHSVMPGCGVTGAISECACTLHKRENGYYHFTGNTKDVIV